ncbi:MAG: hypothetical protein KKD38_08645 [Candidatus Delongbacteria bacterium]|nr:hypothetical protein [Candidatus Delongbacteria bacterium]MCG2760847.1 hypothetical protein [Candidatus Delongbacteria bacterium]
MAKKEAVTDRSTKKELWDAYNETVKKLETKGKQELNPEKIIEEKKNSETVKEADNIVTTGVSAQISSLKSEILKNLNGLEQDFNFKITEYQKIMEAVKIREDQLKELYDIEKAAGTLAALIDAHKGKKEELEKDISVQEEQFEAEIKEVKARWEKEKKEHDLQIKERDSVEEKNRKREKEEYLYTFEREKQQAINKLKDEKAAVLKEIAELKEVQARETEEALKEIEARESAVDLRENSMTELENKVAGFPKELETAVSKAVKEATDRQVSENKAQITLLNKDYEGKINVFESKIENLTNLCEEQKKQISKLNDALSAAYEKIQNIAIRTVDGSTNYRFGQELNKQKNEKD